MRAVGSRFTRRLALLVLALALAVPCLASIAAGHEPSRVVFPPQRMPIKFSHKLHLAKKIDCDFCHDAAPASVSAADNLVPGEDSCSSCHKIDRADPVKEAKPAARCDSCHVYDAGAPTGAPLRVEMPPPFLKFNHKVHVDREIPCQRCHGALTDVEMATVSNLPTMPLCLGCHTGTAAPKRAEDKSLRAPARCPTCHLVQHDGTLMTQFPTGRIAPSGTLKGDAHTLDFATRHSTVGRDEAQYCENCHRKDFCLSCHNGVVKPMSFHGNDYLKIHPIESRKATSNCNGCHRAQTFCLGCHERAGFTDAATVPDAPNSLARARMPQRFHPNDELNHFVAGPRTPIHHSWAAERNIRSCVSCHREDSCLQCHATAGVQTAGLPTRSYNVSPHPVGFAGSRQCDSLAGKNGRVCLKCHATNDPHLLCQ